MEQASAQARGVVYSVCIMWFLVGGAFALLNTVVPLILKDLVGKSAATYQGMLFATTAASGLVLCSVVGHLSDRLGRLRLLRLWAVAYLLAIACVAYAQSSGDVTGLFLARLPALTVPMILMLAICADCVSGPALLQAHGYVRAVFGLSFLVGSLLAGAIGHYQSRFAAVLMGLCLGFAAVVVGMFVHAPTVVKGAHDSYMTAARIVAKDSFLRLVVVAFAMVRVGYVNAYMMFALYTNFRYGWEIFDVGVLMGLVGGLHVLWQYFGIRLLSKLPPALAVETMHVLLWAFVAQMLGYAIAPTGWFMLLVGTVGSMTDISTTILTAKASDIAHVNGIAGLTLGLVTSLQNLIEIFAALGFGRLLSHVISTYQPDEWQAGLPFFVNAAWMAAGALLMAYADVVHGRGREGWRTALPPGADERALETTPALPVKTDV